MELQYKFHRFPSKLFQVPFKFFFLQFYASNCPQCSPTLSDQIHGQNSKNET